MISAEIFVEPIGQESIKSSYVLRNGDGRYKRVSHRLPRAVQFQFPGPSHNYYTHSMINMSGIKSAAAVGLTLLANLALAQEVIINGVVQQDVFFYGQSPPVYPSPDAEGDGRWGDALSSARAIVARMTLEEKVNITGGFSNVTNGCGGNIPAINRLNFPGMCLQDGPNGVRETDFVNGYAVGIHVGAR